MVGRTRTDGRRWPLAAAALWALAIATVWVLGFFGPVSWRVVRQLAAEDSVTLQRDGVTRDLTGSVLVEAQDGGVLLLARDGVLWTVQPEEIVERRRDDAPFQAATHDQLSEQLLEEMPEGFRIHKTAHYVICYNTSEVYAEWCGSLFERLFRGFFNYWEIRGLKLHEPEFPLVALVFQDQSSYAQYARTELGEATSSIIGYYSLRTNRMTMYDMTGIENLRRNERNIRTTAHINQILSQPAAERTVATIVHEATHQLAYNSGLQTRYAGNPFWLAEGLAVYFESPDLNSSKGWRNIGGVNRYNLFQFRQSLNERVEGSLERLIRDDSHFRNPQTAPAAYAEAWALNYYLIRTQTRQYIAYLEELSKLKPLADPSPDERVAQFKRAFGDNLAELEADFLRYMRRVR